MRKLFAEPYVDEVLLFKEAKKLIAGLTTEEEYRQAIADCNDLHIATALMYMYVHQKNDPFMHEVDTCDIAHSPKNKEIKIIVVPGMFYEEHPEVGARGDIVCDVARRCGFESEIIPVSSKGSVIGNAALLLEALKKEQHKNVWLVSFSKGSVEVRYVLEKLLGINETLNIKGWVSISGMPHGSPLATLKQRNLLSKTVWSLTSKCLGVETVISKELCYENDYLRRPIIANKELQVIHIVGFPLPAHLHPELIKFYNRLIPYGPSDGLVSLSDFMSVTGHVYPIWGTDHFLRIGIIGALIYKMCHYISNNSR